MASYTRMRSCAAVAIVLLLLQASQGMCISGESSSSSATEAKTLDMRKLLNISGGQPPIAGRRWTEAERMEPGSCSEENVVLYQSREEHLPSGIPAYSVEIINVCAACTVYDVHVSCGEFASTELVDPSQFQRVGFNDCLVRRGGPLGPSDAVSFQYSNSFAYPLAVANFACE
ncbi:TPD1 protein homolog 1B-like [Oryza brachyantha]|uniref:TPD1 protein homolog 1B-like n=1 Tax=Oryza brachyantha TaxID=4533 RepID=UPI001ADC13D8|nr:TPD1 protein homolog 1B-like [Oryza brachyantha]